MKDTFFNYKGKNIRSIGLFGIGKSNIAVYNYLRKKFPDLSVTVRSSNEADFSAIKATRAFFGEDCFFDIREDILFISPSARRDNEKLIDAERRGVILSSDTEFFFSLSKKDVYAITGSDGKSTTTYITSRLLSDSYDSVIPSANIGEPMTSHLDDAGNISFVAELSSFQLMYQKPKSKRCLITNITENHLNWHKSFDEYISAKSNILDNSKERILNYDSEISRTLLAGYDCFGVYSSKETEALLKSKVDAEIYLTLDNGYIILNGKRLLNTNYIKLKGSHNIKNFMAAIALSHGKAERDCIIETAQSFGGLEHRCEFVTSIDGVDYYDSSIDSSPQRCINTLNMMQKQVVLILGGRSKGLDFSILAKAISEKARCVIINGECAEEIEETLSKSEIFQHSSVKLIRATSFFEAIELAKCEAMPGDAVLLSPAATSYDSFKNFEERGCAFKEYVKKIKAKGF